MLPDDIDLCFAALLTDHVAAPADEIAGGLRAAGAAGFTGISLFAAHVAWALDDAPRDHPHSLDELVVQLLRGHEEAAALVTGGGSRRFDDLLEESGVSVRIVEFMVQWARGDTSGTEREARALCTVAEHLGATHVLGLCVDQELHRDRAVAGLAAAADIASEYGLRVCVEFTPLFGLPDLATAVALVDETARENIDYVIDTFHWTRAPNGATPADLEQIDPARIAFAQLSSTPIGSAGIAAENFARGMPAADDPMVAAVLDRLALAPGTPVVAPEAFHTARLTEVGQVRYAEELAQATRAVLDAARSRR